MEKREQRKDISIMQYGKRRFDGGSEIELIRTIENKQELKALTQAIEEANQKTLQHKGAAVQPHNLSTATSKNMMPGHATPVDITQLPGVAGVATTQQKTAVQAKLLDTVLRGPLQVCIGLVGIFTALLALISFTRMKNDVLIQQSQIILADCKRSLTQGLWETFILPVSVIKVLLKK